MDIDLCNIEKGLEELYKYALGINLSLEDSSGTADDSKSIDNVETSDVQEGLKELLIALLDFKAQRKDTDKAELVIRTEQFESLLQRLEAELRNHITVENQLKIHIEHNESLIEDLEKVEISEKKNLKKLEVKVSGKKPVRNSEAEKVKKEMEEKIVEMSEVVEKKEKVLHKIEFENIKLRNLLEEKTKECENVKKEIIRLSRLTPKREVSSQGENSQRLGVSADKGPRNRLGKSADTDEINAAMYIPERKLTKTNSQGLNFNFKPRIGGHMVAFAKNKD